MRIQHNIAALNSYRQLGGNNNATSKNLEKLSSGYKINRAGDDAAGLAISEKMRAQITGLEKAQDNANDGISLVQTAEGALTEVHSMLNRMVELSEQSANGTYDNETDRANLQKEVDSLKSEIDRISEGTNFNGINLLDGSLSGGGAVAAKAVKIENATTTESTAAAGVYNTAALASGFTKAGSNVGDSIKFSVTYKDNADGANKTQDVSVTLSSKDDGTKVLVGANGKEYTYDDTSDATVASSVYDAVYGEIGKTTLSDKFSMVNTNGAFTFTAKETGSDGAVITGVSAYATTNAGVTTSKTPALALTTQAADSYKELEAAGVTAYNGTNADAAIFNVNGQKFVLAAADTDLSKLDKNVTVLTGDDFDNDDIAKVISQKTGLNVTNNAGTLTFKPGVGKAGNGGLTLQIGDTSDSFNKLSVAIDSMSSKSLGVASIDISTQDGASAAVDVIKTAINTVSSTRGDIGAIQNRLEHTINNLGVTTENVTAAESRIRDTDMAKEMMNYTKNNILIQASQSMLAQANQMPQGVLQLLQ